MSPKTKEICDQIYGGGLKLADLVEILKTTASVLEDAFYEEPPSKDQQAIIDSIKSTAPKVQTFFGPRGDL